jgi:3-isopropylmalate dehydratase
VICEDGTAFGFQVAPFTRHCLLHGLDDIALTLQKEKDISAFEQQRQDTPWLNGVVYGKGISAAEARMAKSTTDW